jgi:hypothetical protein
MVAASTPACLSLSKARLFCPPAQEEEQASDKLRQAGLF